MIERITFPVEPLCIDADSDTMQCILEFTVNAPGDDVETDANDVALKILEWGDMTIEYDLENALALPGKMSFKVSDPQGFLDNLLFESANIDIQGKVTVKLNGDNEFIGHIIEDSIESDEGQSTVFFDAAPRTDIINKTNLYKVFEGSTVNVNPFSYTNDTKISIISILEDIFQLADDSISYPNTLIIFQDWLFLGIKDTFGGYEGNIPFTDLKLRTNNVAFNSSLGVSTAGDLLKLLALEFGCFAGFIMVGKAFFKKLFYYDPDNVQSVNVKKHKKCYKYGLIDYVEIKVLEAIPLANPYAYAPSAAAFTNLTDRFINKQIVSYCSTSDYVSFTTNIFASRTGTSPRFILCNEGSNASISSVYSNNSSQFTVLGTFTRGDNKVILTVERTSGTNDPESSGTLTKVSGDGDATITFTDWETETGDYTVGQATDPVLGLTDHNHYVLAQFLYHYRGNIKNCRVDYFQLYGITYDYLKDFNYDGCKFQPIKMTKHYSQGLTEFEAIYIGAL